MNLARRVAVEAIGTALLLAVVVGSGIMGERLAGGQTALALLANSLATGAALASLILAFGPISGAHFNPLVTLVAGLGRRDAACYVGAQVAGALVGVMAAHLMFDEALFSAAHRARTGAGQWLSEAIATFGLVTVILGCTRARPPTVAYAVGGYIAAAYWFTASTAFANPAVTLARAVSDTFAGIRPTDVPAFVLAQTAGAVCAAMLFRWLRRKNPESAGAG